MRFTDNTAQYNNSYSMKLISQPGFGTSIYSLAVFIMLLRIITSTVYMISRLPLYIIFVQEVRK